MNRIKNIFNKNKKVLSIYFTAGYPNLNDTTKIISELEQNGVDLIEIGLPFSDPLADGPTIQDSSTKALSNGMTTKLLFSQLENCRENISIPLIIMGYFNPILQFGIENFCEACARVGIDGLIIPDLPLEEYTRNYASIFKKNNLSNIFLITPQTPKERILQIDSISDSFIYMVSSASTTGAKNVFNETELNYFKRISNMNLKNKLLVGFGISNSKTFTQATTYADGAIIGSAYIKHLQKNGVEKTRDFINQFK